MPSAMPEMPIAAAADCPAPRGPVATVRVKPREIPPALARCKSVAASRGPYLSIAILIVAWVLARHVVRRNPRAGAGEGRALSEA